jgi:hypothetical protein
MSQEDIIEDITEEALLEDQELVQDTSAEEVTEEQSYSDAIKSVLLGESKSSKKEVEEDEDEDDKEEDEDEDEMEEGYMKASKSKKKMEDEESDEEDEDEEEMDEAVSKKESEKSKKEDEDEDEDEEEMDEASKLPTATGDPETAVIVKDGEKEAEATAKSIAKSGIKPVAQPKGKGDAKKAKGTQDEEESIKSVEKAADSKPSAKQEDLDLLISAEANLTEDFKAKASTLFEAAVSQKVVAEKERRAETYEQNLVEEVTEIRESLITKIDDYLNYVVESWVEENQIEVDSKLRTEIAEGFISSLKNLFVESYIEVPAAKVDLFDDLEKEASEVK